MGHPPDVGTAPPDHLVKLALRVGEMSPCAKSKRGVVAYRKHLVGASWVVVGTGYNGPPLPLTCDRSDACRASCPKRCVHAEMRALAQANHALTHNSELSRLAPVHLIHVELTGVIESPIVACDGPRCWQCSRLVLDVGCAGIWLYEALMLETPRGQAMAITSPAPGIAAPVGVWRHYDAAEFHRVTSARCEVHHGEML